MIDGKMIAASAINIGPVSKVTSDAAVIVRASLLE